MWFRGGGLGLGRGWGWFGGEDDLDFAWVGVADFAVVLAVGGEVGGDHEGDSALADEFEDGEEDADHFGAGFTVEDEVAEADLAVTFEAVFDVGGVEFEGGVVVEDLVLATAAAGGADFLHELGEGFEEVPDLDFFEVEGGWFVVVGEAGGAAGEAEGVGGLAVFEEAGGVLKPFVFKELPHEVGSGIGEVGGGAAGSFGGLILGFDRFWQERGGLDLHQGSGHDEELAGHIDVQECIFPEGVHVFKVGVCDSGDGNVVNVELVAPDQVEQEVQRAVVYIQFYAIFHEISSCKRPLVGGFRDVGSEGCCYWEVLAEGNMLGFSDVGERVVVVVMVG